MDIKPIETHYNGYRYRSRLEARFAVLFDALGIKYEYEFEGFDLGAVGWYLPDFWLPEHKLVSALTGVFVEIKPISLNEKEQNKLETLARIGKTNCVSFEGVPSINTHSICYTHTNFINKFTNELEVLIDNYPLCYCLRCGIPELSKAVTAAKSARFEHVRR